MNYIDINVPTKPYIKKYMENNYGTPCKMDRGDKYGTILFIFLEDQSRDQDNYYRKYQVEMSFRLTSTYYHRRGWEMTRTNVGHFNNIIEEDIKMKLRTFVEAKTHDGATKKAKAINLFLEINGFSEKDFPYETAKKDVDRHCKPLKYSIPEYKN